MNILIPHKWLLEHLDTKATPTQIQKYLSLCGPSVERIEIIEGEPVYDIEVTTNRVDMMSVRGIAREAATILPEFNIDAKLIPQKQVKISVKTKLELKIQNDPKVCHRILAVKLSIPKVSPSPKWMQKKLIQVGQRPINSLVDVTNYVMWELGHPCHVFDYDKFSNKTLIVREAKKGESLTTLDDKHHKTVGGEIIFDDGTGTIIDVPGIMGTKNTVVDQNTKNILLFIESINSEKIRFASMTHAIRSQAAILNEKNVDPELALEAILRGIDLYQEISGAKVQSEIVDIYPQKQEVLPISLKQSSLDTYIGLEIKPSRVGRILRNLGCAVDHQNDTYLVTPSSSRSKDLTIYQDIIEEIARIYGYHNLPSVIMDTPIPNNPSSQDFRLEYKIKTWLSGWGAREIYTYSTVSTILALKSKYGIERHLKIKNPLTDDMTYLRRSLIPSLMQVLNDNQQDNLTIFEMQNVYHPTKPSELPIEELQLAVISTEGFSHTKGLLDSLLDKLFIKDQVIDPTIEISLDGFSPSESGSIIANKQEIGRIGKLLDINAHAFIIKMKNLQKIYHKHPQYIPVATTPPIIEDLTFTLMPKTYLGYLIKSIYKSSKLIENVSHKDTYQQNFTFTITYRNASRPLTDKELAPIRKTIVSNLEKTYSAKLVGNL